MKWGGVTSTNHKVTWSGYINSVKTENGTVLSSGDTVADGTVIIIDYGEVFTWGSVEQFLYINGEQVDYVVSAWSTYTYTVTSDTVISCNE